MITTGGYRGGMVKSEMTAAAKLGEFKVHTVCYSIHLNACANLHQPTHNFYLIMRKHSYSAICFVICAL